MKFEIRYHGKVQAQQRPLGTVSTSNGRQFVKQIDRKESREFKSIVHWLAENELDAHEASPIETACRVELTVMMAIPKSFSLKKVRLVRMGQLFPTRKPDVDNLLKSVMDACSGVLYKDDRYVVEARIRKVYDDYDGFAFSVETCDEVAF